MTVNLRVPKTETELKPRITVVGVGGAGGNAVNNMIRSNLHGVEFVCANTDAQSIAQSAAERKIQLGTSINRGLGAGAKPEVGRAAAEETIEQIMEHIQGSHMCFITAGMGGGTGSGAAPVIARASREMGILTVGVVTKPFTFEGAHRMRIAENAIEDLQQYVDTLIVIPNQNLFRIANERTTFADAFKMADDVLYSGVRGVTDLITMPGLINLDFADIQTVMAEMGKAMMGTGEAEGERRAVDAAEAAINNPLLDDVSMKGARAVLINITGGMDMTLFEVDEAANRIRSEVDPDANIIFGAFFDEKLSGRMRISIVAAGMDAAQIRANNEQRQMGLSTPFGMNLRPQKPVAHADIINSARKPAPQPQSSSPPQPSYASTLSHIAKNDMRPAMPSPAAEPAAAKPVDHFIAPAAQNPETGTESITVIERIVAATPPAMPEPQIMRVNLQQDRPVERAMQQSASASVANPVSNPVANPVASPAQNQALRPERASVLSQSQQQTAEQRAQKRGPGLFERMMGGVMGGKPETAGSAERQEPTLLQPQAPKSPAKETAKEQPQPADLLSNASNDDLLDIPAFLRRGQ
jgi:cell division protein FtsZ